MKGFNWELPKVVDLVPQLYPSVWRKNLFRKAPFNCLQFIIESGARLFNHKVVSPDRDNGNNLNRIAFCPTPGLLKDLQMVTKFTRYRFVSSPGMPPNNPFRFRSWIIVLVMLNFAPGANGGGMIAPIAPALFIPSSPLLGSYWTGWYSCLSQIRRFWLTLYRNGVVICSACLGIPGFNNSSSSKSLSSGFGYRSCCLIFYTFTYALAKVASLSASCYSTILPIRRSSGLGGNKSSSKLLVLGIHYKMLQINKNNKQT